MSTSVLDSPVGSTQSALREDNSGFGKCLSNRQLLMVCSVALAGVLGLITIGLLYFAQAVFFPIVLAIILKLVFGPVVKRMNKWNIPNPIGAGLVLLGIVALIVAALFFLSGPAIKWVDQAPQHFSELSFKLRSLKEPIEKVSDAGDQVAALTEVGGKNKPLPVEVQKPSVSTVVFNATSGIAMGGFLTLVMLYFWLAGGDRFLEKILHWTPEFSSKRNVVELARDIQHSVSSYLFATTCINIVLGVVIGFAMWLLGIPNPVLWGVMAACLNYLPYVGCMVGAAVVFLVGAISFDSLGHALWAPAIYLIVNGIEGYFITPMIIGRSISLSPLAIVVCMILWGWLWGVGGMLIAVPILAATKIACDHIEPLKPAGHFLGR